VDGDSGRVLERHAAGQDVPSLAIACDRYLWACVTGGGLLVVDLSGHEPPRRVTAADGLPDDRALCVGAAGDAVAVGGWSGWVAVLDAARATVRGTVLLHGPAAGRPVTDVAPIPGRATSVWVSSYGGGLLELDLCAPVVRRGIAVDGTLPSDLVYACRVDGRGHVWAGTRHGLVRL